MDLEQIKHNLNKNEYDFFLKLSEDLDLPLFFIGSITRFDFIKGKSDFDIEVVSDNITSTKIKIEHLFSYYKKKGNRFIILKFNNISVSGYKYFLKNKEKNIFFDFSIYKKECQRLLIHSRNIQINIPFSLVSVLIIIKYLHYYLHIINHNTYSYLKKNIWDLYGCPPVIVLNELEYNDYYNKEPQKKYLINNN